MYPPFGHSWPNSFSLVVHTAGPIEAMGPLLRQAVAQRAPHILDQPTRSLDRYRRQSAGTPFSGSTGGVFAGVALLLASLGMYGVLAT